MLLLGDSDAPAPAAAAAATAAALSKAVDEARPPLLRLNFVKYHPNTIVVKRYL